MVSSPSDGHRRDAQITMRFTNPLPDSVQKFWIDYCGYLNLKLKILSFKAIERFEVTLFKAF